MTEEMKLFLVSLQEWVEKGHPEGGLSDKPAYSNGDSICFNVDNFVDWHLTNINGKLDKDHILYPHLFNEMAEHLPGNNDCPFNGGEKPSYREEMDKQEHYINVKRLNWLKEITDKIKSGVYNDN